ncbi:MAG: hypothetical protein J2P36_27390, partial [Ktedonobacteraceae bacterium]|nr:hypothetical protein [Ktedonobacteraceae bacterium]
MGQQQIVDSQPPRQRHRASLQETVLTVLLLLALAGFAIWLAIQYLLPKLGPWFTQNGITIAVVASILLVLG